MIDALRQPGLPPAPWSTTVGGGPDPAGAAPGSRAQAKPLDALHLQPSQPLGLALQPQGKDGTGLAQAPDGPTAQAVSDSFKHQAPSKDPAPLVKLALAADGALGKLSGLAVLNNLVSGEGANLEGWADKDGRQVAREASGLAGKAISQGRAVAGTVASIVSQTAKDQATQANADASKVLGGAGTALSYAGVVKGSLELLRDTALDVSAVQDRKTFQALLKGYRPSDDTFLDPKTGAYVADEARLDQLKALLGKGGADRSRSNAQALVDRGSQVKNIGLDSAWAVAGTFSNVGKEAATAAIGKVATQLIPGLSIAATGLSTVHSAWKTSVNIVALSNAEQAKANAKGDPVLEGISQHILQERTYNARKNLLSTVVSGVSFGINVASLAAGPGAPAALAVASMVSFGLSTGTSLAIAAWDVGHGSLLANRRGRVSEDDLVKQLSAFQEAANDPVIKQEVKQFLSAPQNIGLAERALLHQLRQGGPEASAQAARFLHDLGLKDGTIARLKLLPNGESALKSLRSAIYTDKVSVRLAGPKAAFSALGRVVGLTQLATWVSGKVSRQANSATDFQRTGMPSWALQTLHQRREAAIEATESARRLATVAKTFRPAAEHARNHPITSPRVHHAEAVARAHWQGVVIEFDESSVARRPGDVFDDVDL